jgi:REP element-mobilizing transposase RayT
MKYNPDIHHRRSIRLEGYDYSQAGAYFVTICAYSRVCLFGEVVEISEKQDECHSSLREMVVNDLGKIVAAEWIRSAEIRAEIALGEFVVMPNHFHGIVRIVNDRRGDRPVAQMPVVTTIPGPQPKSIGALVAGFKSAVTKRINETRKSPGVPVWQRNYHEHIIRNDADYNRIAEYVTTNPQRWIEDRLHPDNFIVSESTVGGNGNVGENGKIGGNGNIVGATGRSPLRNVPQLGGCHE